MNGNRSDIPTRILFAMNFEQTTAEHNHDSNHWNSVRESCSGQWPLKFPFKKHSSKSTRANARTAD